MNLYTNDIKKATKYQSDSTVRTASEKRLDRKLQSHLGELEKFEAELFVKQPQKKAKIQIVKQEFIEKVQPKGTQVLDKLFKLCSNQTKILKSLNLMLRFFSSPEGQKLKAIQTLPYLNNLLSLNISSNPQRLKCKTIISQIFQKVLTYQSSFSNTQKQMLQLLNLFWTFLSRLNQDDTFSFNKSVKDFLSTIQDFELNKQDLDNYQDLLTFKQQIKSSQQQQTNTYDSERILYQKRKLIFMILLNLFDLAVNWKKNIIDQFMKKFNNDQKDRILHPKQKKMFQSKYQQYQSIRNKNGIDKQRDQVRDKQIKDNAIKSSHEVKDGRKEVFVGQGSDQWVTRQG